jgi:hypothetical protein
LKTEHPHYRLAHLVAAVPATELCGDTRKHAGFHHTEKETRSVEPFFRLYRGMTGEHDAPGEDDAELPIAGSGLLKQEIAWYFEDDVADLLSVRKRRLVLSKELTK